MTIYIDKDYICHLEDGEDRQKIETRIFNNKCKEFIEGYRYIPAGSVWVREDGEEFNGGVFPHRNVDILLEIQQAVDNKEAERDEELAALIEEFYNYDLEVIG